MSAVASDRAASSGIRGPIDFFARQRFNRRRSLALVALFLAMVVTLGWGIDAWWLGIHHSGTPIPVATLVALSLAAAMCGLGYFWGAGLVMGSLCAAPLNLDDPEQRQLDNIVSEMALSAGLPRPRLMVIPDPAPNALAAGRDPTHAVIGVTEGLLQLLDREETQGVVAHEMAHIGNRDTLTMTLVGVLFGAALMLADWARRTLILPTKRRHGSLLLYALVLALILLTPLLSRLLTMAVSRQREYLADATAVQLTRNPLGLARALQRIDAESSPLRAATRGTAHLFISNPWPGHADGKEGKLADLFSTHPPISRRIAVLKAMAHTF
jgi:heat shock protein HtpX